jgi:hypothetical protein
MATAGTFVCDCGARLTIVTEGRDGVISVPCPTPSCKVRHTVSGKVIQTFIVDKDGHLQPFDWQAPPTT